MATKKTVTADPIDPIANPVEYLEVVRAQGAKTQGLEDRAKSDAFAGEASRHESERAADLRHQAALLEFDQSIRPALKALQPLFNRGQAWVFIETPHQRLATAWAGKFYPLARIGVDEEGNWFWNSDRDESQKVGSAKQAMAMMLANLESEFRIAARAKQSEAERPAQQAAQDNYLRGERRKRLSV